MEIAKRCIFVAFYVLWSFLLTRQFGQSVQCSTFARESIAWSVTQMARTSFIGVVRSMLHHKAIIFSRRSACVIYNTLYDYD